MKKRILILIPLIIIGAGLFYIGSLAPIITGYAAKNLASGIFVAGRTQESLEKEDLNFSFISYNQNTVDFENKEVTSRFLFWKSKAIYLDGFGCTLVRDFSEEEIRNRPYQTVPLPEVRPDTIPWPMGDLLSDTLPSGIDMERLNRQLDSALSNTLPMKGTFAVAVAYKNQLIAERYRDGFSSKNLFLSWSMAKSVTNALTGIMVQKGLFDINDETGIPEWQSDDRKAITSAHLLNMTSGLEWNEDYGSNSDVNKMLFKTGDMAAFAKSKPAENKPDEVWKYSSGTTNLVCKVLRDAINDDAAYYAFPRKELFNRIGMRSAIFEVDPSGTFIGSSYIYATMRDYVRFGLLYLNEGIWNGEQILPDYWTDFTAVPASASEGGYGAFFWLNRDNTYPGVPADMYCCRGHDGQFIYIIPSKELVVVRTGFSKSGEFDSKSFLRGIVESVP